MRADGELLTCEPADGAADGAALFPVLSHAAAPSPSSAAPDAGLGRSTVDTVTLDFDDRYRRRMRCAATAALDFLLDLPRGHGPATTATGLALEDGGFVCGRGGARAAARGPRRRAAAASARARLASRQPPPAGRDQRRPHPDPRRPRHRRHAAGPGRTRSSQVTRAVRSRRRRLRAARHAPMSTITGHRTTMPTIERPAGLMAWLSPAYPVGAFSLLARPRMGRGGGRRAGRRRRSKTGSPTCWSGGRRATT